VTLPSGQALCRALPSDHALCRVPAWCRSFTSVESARAASAFCAISILACSPSISLIMHYACRTRRVPRAQEPAACAIWVAMAQATWMCASHWAAVCCSGHMRSEDCCCLHVGERRTAAARSSATAPTASTSSVTGAALGRGWVGICTDAHGIPHGRSNLTCWELP
jgi:hypothetical protein